MNELKSQLRYLRQHLTQSEKIFVWAIICISIDGFPLIPLNFENKPLSTLFVLIYWFLEKVKYPRLNQFEIRLWLIFFVLLLFTLFKALISYYDFFGFFKFSVTGTFSVITISSCYTFIKGLLKRFSPEDVIRIVTYSLILSSVVPLILGFIQLFALWGFFPLSIAQRLTLLFSYRPLLERAQLTTTEASHGSTYLVLIILWVYAFYHHVKKFRTYILTALFLMFLFISSSLGYITFSLTLLLFALIYFKISMRKFLKYAVMLGLSFFLIYWLSVYFVVEYTAEKFKLLTNLITTVDEEVFYFYLKADYSFLDRVGTPYLSLLSLKDTYFMGAGGESFFYLFPYLVDTYLPEMLENEILQIMLEINTRFVVKFLPAKIAAEFGIIGVTAFLYFIFREFYRLIKLYRKTNLPLLRGLGLCSIFALLSTYLCSYFNFSVILVLSVSFLLRKEIELKSL